MALLLAIAILAGIGMSQLSTPDVIPASAAEAEFSAERAMEHLRVIAAEPRPAGSPGHLATRQYLVDQLSEMGLDPQVQSTTVVLPAESGAEGFGAAAIDNIVARIPGTESTGAIALDAHYDTGPTGPGAMDAGAGVVATLESIRAIQSGPALRNDVIIVFADGEETGMQGAAAFNDFHPWSKDVRLTLNFEGAGGDGAALLYATSRNDDWLVSEFLDVAPDPAAYSLLPTIVHLFPDLRLDCDLGEYTDEGSAGLGFVAIGDTPAYHTVRDDPDVIDPGSIQQMGGYTLATVRHFGNLDLNDLPKGSDSVFFNVLPGVVVQYASTWVLPLAALTTLLMVGVVSVGYRRNQLSARGLLIGAVTFLLGSLGATVAAFLVWAVIRFLNPDYQVMMVGTYQSGLYVIALIFVTITAVTALYRLAGRRTPVISLAAGALLGSLIPLWVASIVVPGTSYLVIWPILFALLPVAWILLVGDRLASPWWRVAVLVVAAIPAAILLPGTLYSMAGLANRMEGLMGLPILGVTMLFVAPLVALLVLHLDFLSGRTGWSRWTVPIVTGAIALVLIGWGNATSGFDAEYPRPDRIAYELNGDTRQARWISTDQDLDDWTRQFFPAGAERSDYDSLLRGTVPAFTGQAPAVALEGPEIDVISETTVGNVRTIAVRLTSDGARVMAVDINAPGPISALSVDGNPADLSDYDWARDGSFPVVYANVPNDGWELTISVQADDPVSLEIEAISDGLPAQLADSYQPRPADTMPAPDYARDPTILTKTFSI